ncbi:MAG: 5-oxoprolinase [Gammaproteobacteria bacterium]|nr:5-oxoprolinase [Gammaproteobacteria bacterium]
MANQDFSLTDQIIWDRLIAIVEDQAQTLVRTAFSTTVREAGDLSAGLFDNKGRMLAQAITGTPGHVNAMAASVKNFLEKFKITSLKTGDSLLTNDPWHGTGHLNDFTVVTPVFYQDAPIGLFAATSHIADVGGLGFGADGKQVYEEGINLPIDFLFKEGIVNATLMEILKANVRDPEAAEGDLYSLASCNQVAGETLIETMKEFSISDLDAIAGKIIEKSRNAMIAQITELPEGSWTNSMKIDGFHEPIDLKCKLEISTEGVSIDWAGTSKKSTQGINVPLTYAQAYSCFGIRCLIGNDIPNNSGSLSAIQVSAPLGCILNAPRPSAVSARHMIGQMLPDVVIGALDEPLQKKVIAEGAACLYGPVFYGGKDFIPESKCEPFVMNAFYTGGTGARPNKDGLSCTAFPSGVRGTPVEIAETCSPMIMLKKEYRAGSGGQGEFRGGHGQRIEFAHIKGEPFYVSKMFDRIKNPPRGRHGGGEGRSAKVYLKGDKVLNGMGRELIPAGKTFVLETAGGGGLGKPKNRDPKLKEKDKKERLAKASLPEFLEKIFLFLRLGTKS